MKDKVAFVVIRYGQNMNGGAEQHCRMLAERLVTHYDVEILTTCVKDYVKGTNELPEGEEWIDDILVKTATKASLSTGIIEICGFYTS